MKIDVFLTLSCNFSQVECNLIAIEIGILFIFTFTGCVVINRFVSVSMC